MSEKLKVGDYVAFLAPDEEDIGVWKVVSEPQRLGGVGAEVCVLDGHPSVCVSTSSLRKLANVNISEVFCDA